MLANFRTERVEYIIDEHGYSRNGSFVHASNMKILQIGIGQSASFSYTIGQTSYVIETDPVVSITNLSKKQIDKMTDDHIPKAYRLQIRQNKRNIIRYHIGTKQDVASWAAGSWPNALIALEPCRRGIYKSIAN
ncbi:hypothetical protein [Paenibacillus sp. IITD108]|uniref:hypothetical protein n=1 Tax=Paenibacillus sp. IITD108 TaxID=3116649 RepID=UPI002F427C21